MYDIIKYESILCLYYRVENGNDGWVEEELNKGEEICLRKVFTFVERIQSESLLKQLAKNSFLPIAFGEYYFTLGELTGDYYKIDKDILSIGYDIYFHKDMNIDMKSFIIDGGISVFKKITELSNEDIYIGGAMECAIPVSEFQRLLDHFPTAYERKLYSESRISHILKHYLGSVKDAEYKLEKYVSKKDLTFDKYKIDPDIIDNEIIKYTYILNKLNEMLVNSKPYSENEWQKIIINFILLLMPKYMTFLEKAPIHDFYSKPKDIVKRQCDIMLVDFNGYIDVIEIKQPLPNSLVYPNPYRNNYIPKRDLTGPVMQLEKYIFHLSKWGHAGEDILNDKYKGKIPNGIRLKIANPKGIIITGRNDLLENQMMDFEIIKRKYSNIVDIITYDDLAQRLKNVIEMLEKRRAEY